MAGVPYFGGQGGLVETPGFADRPRDRGAVVGGGWDANDAPDSKSPVANASTGDVERSELARPRQ